MTSSWSTTILAASLVAVASFVYCVGPRSPLAIGSILVWSLLAGLAAIFGYLETDGTCACCPGEGSAATGPSPQVLQKLTALASQDRILRELSLEDLTAQDGTVIASAIAEFGSVVGLERLSMADSPSLSESDWQGLLSTSLVAGSKLSLLELDLSGNIGITDPVIEVLVKLLEQEGDNHSIGHNLAVLRLPCCSLTAVGVAYIAGWTSSAKQQGLTVPPIAAEEEAAAASTPAQVLPPPLAPGNADPPLAGPLASSRHMQGGPLQVPSVNINTLLEMVEGPQLQFISFSGNMLAGCGRSIARIERLPSLTELELADCSLSADDVERIASALPRSSLSRLELAKNGLGQEGALALAKNLASCKVDSLGLEENAIPGGRTIDMLSRAYEKRPFSSLRLEGNKVSKAEMAALAQKLKAARTKAGFVMAACPLGCECNGRGDVM